jgi:hypothetical protein
MSFVPMVPLKAGFRTSKPPALITHPVVHLLQVLARQVERDRPALDVGLKGSIRDRTHRLDHRHRARSLWGLVVRAVCRARDPGAHVRDDGQDARHVVGSVQVPHEVDDGATGAHAVVEPDVLGLVDLERRRALLRAERARVPKVTPSKARRLVAESAKKFGK